MPRKRVAGTQEKAGKSKRDRPVSSCDDDEVENMEIEGEDFNGSRPGASASNEERASRESSDGHDSSSHDFASGADAGGEFLADFSHELDHLEVPPPPPPIMNFDGTGPRLLIRKIVNENFKSYYGRHTLGPFHKNFSSIVGPNGSGKSNVIDSLLFVFGYRAQKIRSKNISVLIHNSEQHPNVDSCSVEVHFVKIIDKTNDEFEEVEGSAFVIGRTAFRDNSSTYFINKRRVQFKDVGALLRQHGIDIDHNRFLILQGEVEQISLMKPKAQAEGEEGMLEYLEDIIGSSRLKPCLDSLHKRMEELNEMRNDKAQRVKSVEEEKAELEGPKNEAVAFLELENSITRKKNVLYQRYLLEAGESCATVVRELDAAKVEYEDKEKAVQTLKEEIKGKQHDYEQIKAKHDKLQTDADAQSAVFKELEKEDTKLREDFKHRKEKMKTLDGNRETETKKLNDLRKQPEKCDKQLEDLQAKCKELESKREKLESQLQDGMSKLREETKSAQEEKKVMEEKLIARQKGVTDAREKLDLAKSELELCLSAQTREITKLEELKSSLEKITQTLEDCERKIEEAEKVIPEMEERARGLDRRLREVTAQEKDLNEKIRDKTSRVGMATANLQSYGNRNRVLEYLFSKQRRGDLSGIFGRLGDLGAIDEQYDVAISTACGPLDNIVVDTINTAQRCVEYLNKDHVGIATFIALDKMNNSEQAMKQPFRAPEGVKRLFDLLVVDDPRVLPAFYYALRDTLVANDLDQATRVAFQGGRARYRVVTVGGEIIDVSGTMSGGGARQSRGRMGRSVKAAAGADDLTPEQLQNLERELHQQRTELDNLRTQRLQMEVERDKLGPSLQNKILDLNAWRMDVKAANERKQTLQKQITSQEKVVKATVPDEAEKRRLTENVEVLQKKYDSVAEASAVIEADVKRVDIRIQSIKENCIGWIQKELDACKRQMEEAEKSIGKSKVAARSAQRNIKNSEEKLAGIEQDIERNKAAIEKIHSRLLELETEGAEVVLRRDRALKALKSFEADLQNAKEGVATLEEEEQRQQSALMDLKTRLDHIEQTLKNLQQKKKYWEKEVKILQLHNIRQMCGLPPEVEQEQRRDIEMNDEEGADAAETEDEVCGELKQYSAEYLGNIDPKQLTVQLTVLEDNLKAMKPNLDVLNEYRKKEEKYQRCMRQMDEVTKMRDKYRTRFEDLRKQRLNEFMDGFSIVSSKLKEMYQMITLGGDADLELVDTMDPFTEGIAFSVRPPKKSWKQISNLSGGEKTLSSLSLVFALHHYKPTPLYVMDEIDAALDYKNVSIVANYIKERTKNAQFIIISLRNNMFELADRLIGIYKTHHCTKSVVINPGKISIPARARPLTASPASRVSENALQDVATGSEAALPTEAMAAEPVPTITDKFRMTPVHV